MQPWPPCAMKPRQVPSSPDNWLKSGPSSARCCDTRTMLAVASLTPAMFLQSNSRFMVSTDMSTTERPGIL